MIESCSQFLAAASGGSFDWSKVVGPLIGAIVGGLVTLAITWFNRKRPSVIECTEMIAASLVDVRGTRSEIDIKFRGTPVTNLSQAVYQFVNAGSEVVRDIRLLVEFQEGTKILQWTALHVECTPRQVSERVLELVIPFLNPYRPHRDALGLTVVCDGAAQAARITGRGDGWSVRRRALGRRAVLKTFAVGVAAMLLAFTTLMMIVLDTESMFAGVAAGVSGVAALVAVSAFLTLAESARKSDREA